MASEFYTPTRDESERIKEYLERETHFMAAKNFYQSYRNVLYRRRAHSLIAKYSRMISSDAYIPYLAVTYFDRVFSRNPRILMKVLKAYRKSERVWIIAIACLALAVHRRRRRRINANQIYMSHLINDEIIDAPFHLMSSIYVRGVFSIGRLAWEIEEVTPLSFLNYFYQHFFKYGCVFKRRSIDEIIVQAQGVTKILQYAPSQIALSAFLTASKIAYPSKYDRIANTSNLVRSKNSKGEITDCVNQMIDLCSKLKIHIEPAESGTSKVKEIQQSNSRAVGVNSNQSQAAVVDSSNDKATEDTEGNDKAVNVIKIPDEDRFEAMIRRTLEKLEKVEKPWPEKDKWITGNPWPVEGKWSPVEMWLPLENSELLVSELLVKPMNFELKWPIELKWH